MARGVGAADPRTSRGLEQAAAGLARVADHLLVHGAQLLGAVRVLVVAHVARCVFIESISMRR